jgi:hypothetical protein
MAAIDLWANDPYIPGGAPSALQDPLTRGVAVSVSDTEMTYACRAIFVGGAGNLSLLLMDGTTTLVISGVLAGTLLPIRARAIKAATTATNIVALW